ncbi:MAG: hypothetical protein K9M54_12315, partial [Kiritimatiellales bacterium]|nr:hypothetical protein [Kiritimatiellales bacterium]
MASKRGPAKTNKTTAPMVLIHRRLKGGLVGWADCVFIVILSISVRLGGLPAGLHLFRQAINHGF